jgi:tripartite-type tricarboxylate transporter receptor subunit TctC
LGRQLGQPVVIENQGGGGGLNSTESYAKYPPDGYTLLLGAIGPLTIIPAAEKVSYDPLHDFTPLGLVWTAPLTLAISPTLGIKTLKDFIAYAKANPDKINMGSGGNGSTGHMAGELFMMMTGVRMVHVPYRGESIAMTDLLGGQAQIVFATTGSAIAFAKAGTVRTLAVTTPTRLYSLPDVPPLAQFLPGYEATGWSGLCAPKSTPAEIVGLLNKEINAALADPNIRQRLADMGGTAPGGSAADFGKFIADDTEKWARVVKFSGAQAH